MMSQPRVYGLNFRWMNLQYMGFMGLSLSKNIKTNFKKIDLSMVEDFLS